MVLVVVVVVVVVVAHVARPILPNVRPAAVAATVARRERGMLLVKARADRSIGDIRVNMVIMRNFY